MSTGDKTTGGEGGIRTLDTGVSPYNGLANRRLQPLGHLSGVRMYSLPRSLMSGLTAFDPGVFHHCPIPEDSNPPDLSSTIPLPANLLDIVLWA